MKERIVFIAIIATLIIQVFATSYVNFNNKKEIEKLKAEVVLYKFDAEMYENLYNLTYTMYNHVTKKVK